MKLREAAEAVMEQLKHGWVEEELARFAALVASAERERCAQVCEDHFMSDGHWCAQAIRKGGGKDPDRIHSCSYYCMNPACIQAQRDELRDKLENMKGKKDEDVQGVAI